MKPVKPPRNFITEREVASMLGISTKTLQKHRHEHRGLPYLKFGRAVRYDLQDVEDWIAGKRIDPKV